MTSHLSG